MISGITETTFDRLFKGFDLAKVVDSRNILLFIPKLIFFVMNYFQPFQKKPMKDGPLRQKLFFYHLKNKSRFDACAHSTTLDSAY